MVRITCLPLGSDFDIKKIIKKLSEDVSLDTGIDRKMITYYWQTFDAIYCPGSEEPTATNIIFVDLYIPGFMSDIEIASVMISLANSIEKHTKISKKFVLIQAHVAEAKHVFISGKMAKWSDYTSDKK